MSAGETGPRGQINIAAEILRELLQLPAGYEIVSIDCVGGRPWNVPRMPALALGVTGPRVPKADPDEPWLPAVITPRYERTETGAVRLAELQGLEPEEPADG